MTLWKSLINNGYIRITRYPTVIVFFEGFAKSSLLSGSKVGALRD